MITGEPFKGGILPCSSTNSIHFSHFFGKPLQSNLVLQIFVNYEQ